MVLLKKNVKKNVKKHKTNKRKCDEIVMNTDLSLTKSETSRPIN